MFRLSRRFTAALLWIAIALLPVRGFAAVVMPMFVSTLPAAVASAPADSTAAVMPCHVSVQSDSSAPAGASHACSLCDLCHGTVAQVALPGVTLAVPHEAQPDAAAPPLLEPRAPDSLFRPPRTSLA
jgi:hypothetical protein